MNNPFWQFVKSLPSPRRAALERFLELTADPSQIGLKRIWGNRAHIVGAPAALGGMASMKPQLQQPHLNDHVTILERTVIPWGTTEQILDEATNAQMDID